MKSLLTLVGTKFRPRGPELLRETQTRHPVLLVREPKNLYDKNAIAVYVAIGYIKATEAKEWADQIDTLNPVGTVPGLLIPTPNGPSIEIEA